MSRNITVEELLVGTTFGRRQSVGPMEVIPILGDDDEEFAPPDVSISTSSYGTVRVRNDADLPTVVPVGAGWVVKQAAQDHAIGGAVFVASKRECVIHTAACIQQTQGGYITSGKHEMLILPVALRSYALAMRKDKAYHKLWGAISKFNDSVGITHRSSHLEFFLQTYQKTLDEFVAEFEIVPRMVGAVVLIGGVVAGIEKGPNAAYWGCVWQPLIRVCYGSLAIQFAKSAKTAPLRTPFSSKARSVEGLLKSLHSLTSKETKLTNAITSSIMKNRFVVADTPDGRMHDYRLVAVANSGLAGQIVYKEHFSATTYLSVCATSVYGGKA